MRHSGEPPASAGVFEPDCVAPGTDSVPVDHVVPVHSGQRTCSHPNTPAHAGGSPVFPMLMLSARRNVSCSTARSIRLQSNRVLPPEFGRQPLSETSRSGMVKIIGHAGSTQPTDRSVRLERTGGGNRVPPDPGPLAGPISTAMNCSDGSSTTVDGRAHNSRMGTTCTGGC